MIRPIILWTDALFFILIIAIILFVFWARKQQYWRAAWRSITHDKLAIVAMFVLLTYTLIGLLDSIHFQLIVPNQNTIAESLFDYLVTPLKEHTEKTYSAPFASHLYDEDIMKSPDGTLVTYYPSVQYRYHILGTNRIGDDVLYLSLKSIRTALMIGTLTTLVMLPFAVLLGMVAGYFRGWFDDGVQYIYTTLSSIPDILLIAAAVLAWEIFMMNHPSLFPTILQRADIRLLTLCIILGITSWTALCRLLRGETLKLREMEYVVAARALGERSWSILLNHILPNLTHIIIINVVMDFSLLVLAEAVLTYVGVGVDPTTISWGNMIFSAREELAREPVVWWPLFSAFLFMFPLVICANLFADAVRDALDPRIKISVPLRKSKVRKIQ